LHKIMLWNWFKVT